jgi:hypothetical protein
MASFSVHFPRHRPLGMCVVRPLDAEPRPISSARAGPLAGKPGGLRGRQDPVVGTDSTPYYAKWKKASMSL